MSRSEVGHRCRGGCGPDCDAVADAADLTLERNRYFTGKHMRARDFAADTDYLLDRHRLHNRLLHGWGIVCGLDVRHHPDPKCRDEWIVIEPGTAIDCLGREIMVTEPLYRQLPFDQYENDGRRHDFLVGVRFCEQRVELVRVLYSEDGCDPQHAEANRLRDGAAFVTSRVRRRCWTLKERHGHHDEPGQHRPDDEDQDERHGERPCFAADCPCGDFVPLARIVPGHQEGGFHIDREGRRYLPPPASRMTRIERINWPHGGTITSRYLDQVMERRLRVTFSHRLQPQEDGAGPEDWTQGWQDDGWHDRHDEDTGVNEHTFTVQFVQMSRGLEFLSGGVELDRGDRQAVFQMNHRPSECIIYVTLQCDFILDRDGVPVDGNHLRGRLPTGNGVPGGVFQSWFRVVPERGRRPY